MVLKKDSLFFVSKSWDNNIRAYFTPFYIVESNRMHPYFQEKKTCRSEAAIKGCGGLEGGLPFFVSKSWDINVATFQTILYCSIQPNASVFPRT